MNTIKKPHRKAFTALAIVCILAILGILLIPVFTRTHAKADTSYPINSGNRYLENWGGQNVITFPAQEFTYSPQMSMSASNFMNVKMQWGINPNVTPTNTNGLFLRIETLTNNNSSVQMFAFSDEGFYTSDSLTGDDKAILTQAYYGSQALPGHTTQLTVNYLENNIQTINRNFRVNYTLNCTRKASSAARYWEFTSTITDISNEQNNPIAAYTMLNNIAAPSAGNNTKVIVKNYTDGSNTTYTYSSTLPTGNNTYSILYFYINTAINPNAIYSQEQYDNYGNQQYQNGYNEGYDTGSKEGYNVGYNDGKADGFEEGVANDNNFLSLMTAVVDAPVKVFNEMFDVEILGFNMKDLVIGLLSAVVIVALIRVFAKGG